MAINPPYRFSPVQNLVNVSGGIIHAPCLVCGSVFALQDSRDNPHFKNLIISSSGGIVDEVEVPDSGNNSAGTIDKDDLVIVTDGYPNTFAKEGSWARFLTSYDPATGDNSGVSVLTPSTDKNGDVYAFNQAFDNTFTYTPVEHGGTRVDAYFNPGPSKLSKFSGGNGGEIWSILFDGFSSFSNYAPVICKDVVVVTDFDSNITAFSLDKGERMWSINVGDIPFFIQGSLGLVGNSSGMIVVPTKKGLFRLNKSGDVVWSKPVGFDEGEVHYTEVTESGIVGIVSQDLSGEVADQPLLIEAFDKNGEDLWDNSIEPAVVEDGEPRIIVGSVSPIAAANDVEGFDALVVAYHVGEGNTNSYVQGFDAKTGESLWKILVATERGNPPGINELFTGSTVNGVFKSHG